MFVKAAQDLLCSPRQGRRAACWATGLRDAPQRLRVPSLQLSTCEMRGLEVCKHFLSKTIVLRAHKYHHEGGFLRKFRPLLLVKVPSLSMAPKSCVNFLRPLLHTQDHLRSCRSNGLNGREGLGRCEMKKQQTNLGASPRISS